MMATKEAGVGIRVPYVPEPGKYAQRRVQLVLNVEQAPILRAVFEGLERRQAKLKNGIPVSTPQKAIQWILEEIERRA